MDQRLAGLVIKMSSSVRVRMDIILFGEDPRRSCCHHFQLLCRYAYHLFRDEVASLIHSSTSDWMQDQGVNQLRPLLLPYQHFCLFDEFLQCNVGRRIP
jgi:hypothetical protein